MSKKKFHFNPQTLNYEQVEVTFGSVMWRIFLFLLVGVVIGLAFFFVFFLIFPSPSEKLREQQVRELRTQYEVLNRQVDELQLVMIDLRQRDDNLYRVLLQAEPLSNSVSFATSVSRSNYYDDLLQKTNSQLAADLTRKVDLLEKTIYVQNKSYDEIISMAQTNEERMRHIPSIQPILNKDLTRIASGYGYRMDPIYHTRRFHAGMDFTAPTGTDIFATGDGVVELAGWKQGYGNCVIINHGFGYETLYGHMHKILVRKGMKVKRGDVIGLVGNTGKSTGPHCHYEVHYKGNVVDPRNYYFQDLSPEEYDKMIQMADNYGQAMD
ncbi:MAG: M23 family metallopeptidase [Paludibacteraceae bacterium]|nr:M23 family metallopeptidase [Paludibacteraceae bacterium]